MKCPDCGNEVKQYIGGECRCGENRWKWDLYDHHLVLNCLNCDYQMTFQVDFPFTDIFIKGVLGDEKGRIRGEGE